MSYEKTVWQAGDTITAAKLNNIENALESLSSSSIKLTAFSLENNTQSDYELEINAATPFCYISNNKLVYSFPEDQPDYIIPCDGLNNNYVYSISIRMNTPGRYQITANGSPLTFREVTEDYHIDYQVENYAESIAVIINTQQ